MWSTILVIIAVMGQASCMSKYSPLIEKVKYPCVWWIWHGWLAKILAYPVM
jgi:hypothetical protein